MAEFLAIHQSDASLLGCLLRRLAVKVSLGDAERAAGVGFFQSDDLLLRKRPLGGQPALPEKLAEGVESEAALICSGAVGPVSRSFNEQMTLPFRFKRWLFAAAGQPEALGPVRSALLKNLPDYLRRSVKGDSAAEAMFFTFGSNSFAPGPISQRWQGTRPSTTPTSRGCPRRSAAITRPLLTTAAMPGSGWPICSNARSASPTAAASERAALAASRS